MENLELDRQFQISSREQDGYYHEYCRLYLANVVLTNQVKGLMEEKNHLHARLTKLQDDEGYSSYDRDNDKNKRFRRTAHEIQRYYKCVIKACEKSYGSQGSLNQHYKLKHPEIYVALPSVKQIVPSQAQQTIKIELKSEMVRIVNKQHSQPGFNDEIKIENNLGSKRKRRTK